jgi:hypothetical protein
MDSRSCIVQLNIPAGFNDIRIYADSSRVSFEDIRRLRKSNPEQAKQALNEFLENCLFKNCLPNNGYIEALGFHVK